MPWRGLEPRRLAAPPPQDGVSTNFTTRANGSYQVSDIRYQLSVNKERIVDEMASLTVSPKPYQDFLIATTSYLIFRSTEPTGLEPATSRVTVECSNQAELRPQLLESGSETPSSLRTFLVTEPVVNQPAE
jgi:hypothetical protein